MLIIKHTVHTTAPAWAVWQILQDVSNWPTWDNALEYASINGSFTTGTVGKLKFKDTPELAMKLTLVKPQELFISDIEIFFARTVSSHLVVESNGKTTVTFTTEIKGILAFFWTYIIGSDVKKKVPIEMLQLVKKAEELDRH